ncbi:unnamed protein product [Oppiella nova]|uniref:Uncharacterized protein n=1 Tax=Oppiella nova TaxID=334625 RepID=A0A7R9LCY4_9ACAR|nr:unnamed protein product [Oppiella nova]CAG2161780.1 unnamed protein product [Oppiella nova]
MGMIWDSVKEITGNVLHLRTKFVTNKRLDGQVVVITGANSGIGRETALQLSLLGAKVIMGCRDPKRAGSAVDYIKANNKNAVLSVIQLDLSSLESVRDFAKKVSQKETNIDILINNAGIAGTPESQTKEGFEMQFGTNHLGHFLLTLLLLPLLKGAPKARVVSVSSGLYKVGKIHFDNINLRDGAYAPMKAYNQSKLANVLFTRELAKRLGPNSTISAYCLHPGAIKTDIVKTDKLYERFLANIVSSLLFLTPHMGAQTSLYCALEDSIENETGFYYENCKKVDLKPIAMDDKTAAKLWELSTELVNLEEHLNLPHVKQQAWEQVQL